MLSNALDMVLFPNQTLEPEFICPIMASFQL